MRVFNFRATFRAAWIFESPHWFLLSEDISTDDLFDLYNIALSGEFEFHLSKPAEI